MASKADQTDQAKKSGLHSDRVFCENCGFPNTSTPIRFDVSKESVQDPYKETVNIRSIRFIRVAIRVNSPTSDPIDSRMLLYNKFPFEILRFGMAVVEIHTRRKFRKSQ